MSFLLLQSNYYSSNYYYFNVFFKKGRYLSRERYSNLPKLKKKKAKRWQPDMHLQSPQTPGSGLSISMTAPLPMPLPETSVEVGDIQLASQMPFPKVKLMWDIHNVLTPFNLSLPKSLRQRFCPRPKD